MNTNTPLKATELRIGNWIADENGEQFQATAYTPLVIEREEKKLYGIPLTEDWLIKFGFVSSEFMGNEIYTLNQELHDMGGIGFATQEALISFENSAFMLCLGIRDNEIKYVHILQNSIFYLTNTELTIKQ